MRMTVKDLQAAIGQTVMVKLEAFTIPMKVVDAKNSYGNIRLEVEPVNGEGRAFVELSRISKAEFLLEAE